MKWRIYYGDGSTYSGESDEDAFNAPTINVQVLKLEVSVNPNGYVIHHGMSFFCWEHIMRSDGTVLAECRWGGKSDIWGLSNYYHTHKGAQKVLMGIEIYSPTYQEICGKAIQDGCFCITLCDHVKPEGK